MRCPARMAALRRSPFRVIRVGLTGSGDFRSSPVNGHSQDRRACLKSARNGPAQDAAECFTQRLDKNSKRAPVNAAGSRLGASWTRFGKLTCRAPGMHLLIRSLISL